MLQVLKRKWLPILLFTLAALALVAGYSSIQSVRKYRASAVTYDAVITDVYHVRGHKKNNPSKIWISIAYVDANGVSKSAMAHARYYAGIAPGDPVVAYFAKGKRSATLKSWKDWQTGACLIVVGLWLCGIGYILRNFLDSSRKKRKSKSKEATPSAPIPKAITYTVAGIGASCLATTLYLLLLEIDFKRHAVDVGAVVAEYEPYRIGLTYTYEYPAGTLHKQSAKSGSSSRSWLSGDTIPIQVDAREPSRSQIKDFTDQWFAATIMGIFGALFGGVGFGMIFSRTGKNS